MRFGGPQRLAGGRATFWHSRLRVPIAPSIYRRSGVVQGLIGSSAAGVPARRGILRGEGGQFCAPPKPFIASVIPLGFSRIWEKRTTVTVSSIATARA